MSSYLWDYTLDMLSLIAISKKQDGGPDYDYADGLLMAYHEVISLMQQQAEAFGIPLTLVRLDDINSETELL